MHIKCIYCIYLHSQPEKSDHLLVNTNKQTVLYSGMSVSRISFSLSVLTDKENSLQNLHLSQLQFHFKPFFL